MWRVRFCEELQIRFDDRAQLFSHANLCQLTWFNWEYVPSAVCWSIMINLWNSSTIPLDCHLAYILNSTVFSNNEKYNNAKLRLKFNNIMRIVNNSSQRHMSGCTKNTKKTLVHIELKLLAISLCQRRLHSHKHTLRTHNHHLQPPHSKIWWPKMMVVCI